MTNQLAFAGCAETVKATPRIPALMRAVFLVLVLNAATAMWFYLSPNAGIPRAKPEPASQVDRTAKPSAFEVVAVEKPRRGVRMPQKIEPVLAQFIPGETGSN